MNGDKTINIITPRRSNDKSNNLGSKYKIIGGRLLDPQDEAFDIEGNMRGINARKERGENKALFIIYLIDLEQSNLDGEIIINQDLQEELVKLENKTPLIAYSFIFSKKEDDEYFGGLTSIFSEENDDN